jgi:hypothetical protein
MNAAVSVEAQENLIYNIFSCDQFLVLNFSMAHCLKTDTSDSCIISHVHAKFKATKPINKYHSEQDLPFHTISWREKKVFAQLQLKV